jgi:hypothetical protein
MLAGKKASVSLGLQETLQTVSGSSTPKDFETMMQLLFLRFARPNYNKGLMTLSSEGTPQWSP